jgi:hypothetical protein
LTRTLENYEARQHAVQKLFYSFLPVDTFWSLFWNCRLLCFSL